MKTKERDMELGRFGHHPDPAVDFCAEVDTLAGLAEDVECGLESVRTVLDRVEKAMSFTVGGDLGAIGAKSVLRHIEKRMERFSEQRREDHWGLHR